jgi:hypothetical protein
VRPISWISWSEVSPTRCIAGRAARHGDGQHSVELVAQFLPFLPNEEFRERKVLLRPTHILNQSREVDSDFESMREDPTKLPDKPVGRPKI